MTDSVFPQRAEIQIFEDRTGRWVAVMSMNDQTYRTSPARSITGAAGAILRVLNRQVSEFESTLTADDYARRRAWKSSIGENSSVE